MEYKKIIIPIILAIFLLSITSVCASEIDDTIASEDTDSMELSIDNEIDDEKVELTDDDETLSVENDDASNMNWGNYSDLAQEIGSGGNIELKHDYYTYDKGNTINISDDNSVIDGKGAVIDMAGSNIRAFYVTASSVTIKNLTIKNVKKFSEEHGGAIYFAASATVTNCNFVNNTLNDNGHGGAIFSASYVTVRDCNFVNNSVNDRCRGGAIYFNSEGSVTNCNFIGNTADKGGAVSMDSGNVTNCNFTENTAFDGGAVFFSVKGNVTNCNFIDNHADDEHGDGGAVFFDEESVLTNCYFTGNTARNGGAVNFYRVGIVTNCNFADNNASNMAGAILFNNAGSVSNCSFTDNTAVIGGALYFSFNANLLNCSFINNAANDYGGAVAMSAGYVTNCNFTGNTAPNAGGALYICSANTLSNCNFTCNNAYKGSAIYYENHGNDMLSISNSILLNNRANAEALEVTENDNKFIITFKGGDNLLNAIYSSDNDLVEFRNVTYWGVEGIENTDTTATPLNNAFGQNITVRVIVNDELVLDKVYITDGAGTITLENNFGDNYLISIRHDTDSYYTEAKKIISKNMKFSANVTSISTNNRTVNLTLKSNIPDEIIKGELHFILPNNTVISANYAGNGTWWAVHTFDGYSVYQISAAYSGLDNVAVNNGTVTITKADSTITLEDIVMDYDDSLNVAVTTTGACAITAKIDGISVPIVDFTILISGLDAGNHTLTVTALPDEGYNPATKEVTVTVNKVDSTLTVSDIAFDYGSSGSAAVSFTGADGVNASVVGQSGAVVKVNGTLITVSGLNVGTYTLTVTAIGDANHNNITKNATITVNKLKTEITGSAITATYNVNKNLVITLKDSAGKALSGVNVTVDVNGAKTYTTDSNGQIKVSTKGFAPKTYTAKVAFNGDAIYDNSTKDIKITVKKATPKLTAKKKTFKRSVKVKKYSIVLKDNVGKAIKKAKVTIKIGKKTYTAKTNSKGKATFKVKKLTKKGTYKSTVTFKGNAYYNKVTKKVNIKIK